ncbi:hypothetical protein RF11_04025 [Thelohanellus kitauei]|uniref:Uncharacterized protein n=1 Tax=Thelohanellus kitauei TaxID=669202 RepID=A0A0C2N5Q7_THEKT|nr:hypothetical protein RF11_04025 [Thelohanellus kitauei]
MFRALWIDSNLSFFPIDRRLYSSAGGSTPLKGCHLPSCSPPRAAKGANPYFLESEQIAEHVILQCYISVILRAKIVSTKLDDEYSVAILGGKSEYSRDEMLQMGQKICLFMGILLAWFLFILGISELLGKVSQGFVSGG